MAEVLPNNGLQSALEAPLSAGGTTLQIKPTDAARWNHAGEFRAVIAEDPVNGPWELVRVTGGQGTDTLTVTRAVEAYNGDQAARPWSAGAAIAAVITKVSLQTAIGVSDPLTLQNGLTLDTANLTFVGASNRILADFSSATVLSRTLFQNSAANSLTEVGAIPSGTATSAYWEAYNSSDPANSSGLWVGIDGVRALIQTTKLGTAPYVPLAFFVGGGERLTIATTGAVTIPGTLGVTGAISGSNVNLTAQLSMPQGNSVYWSDTNSRIMSSGRATYFDEYNAGWYWRNSATGFSNSMSLGGAGALTVASDVSVGGALTVAGRTVINATSGGYTVASSAGNAPVEIAAAAAGASQIAFHRPGYYAANFGLDTDNQFKIGGWSMGAVSYRILTTNDYSEAAAGSKLVIRDASGYIRGTYINMTADVSGAAPAYVAGQNGDNYLRWYSKSLIFPAATYAYATGASGFTNMPVGSFTPLGTLSWSGLVQNGSTFWNTAQYIYAPRTGYYTIFARVESAAGCRVQIVIGAGASSIIDFRDTQGAGGGGGPPDYGAYWFGYLPAGCLIYVNSGHYYDYPLAASFLMVFAPNSTYSG
jgi:hypothetical protein